MRRWAALSIGTLWWVANAHAEPKLRLETGAGFDTNVTRAEGQTPRREAALARLVADLESAGGAGRLSHHLAGQAGAKTFVGAPGEDVVFSRASAGVAVRALPWLAPGLRLGLQDRTSRAPERPRDYARAVFGPSLDLSWGPLTGGLFAEGERLVFKPDARFDATAFGVGLHLGGQVGGWAAISARVSAHDRRFTGERFVDGGAAGPVPDPSGLARRDGLYALGLSARSLGDWVWLVEYSLVDNRSDSFNGSFVRHEVGASATVALPLDLLASIKVSVQRLTYADVIALSPLEVLSDENRSAALARLEWAATDHLSLVLAGGAWFSPFGTGPEFARYTATLGLAFNDG